MRKYIENPLKLDPWASKVTDFGDRGNVLRLRGWKMLPRKRKMRPRYTKMKPGGWKMVPEGKGTGMEEPGSGGSGRFPHQAREGPGPNIYIYIYIYICFFNVCWVIFKLLAKRYFPLNGKKSAFQTKITKHGPQGPAA